MRIFNIKSTIMFVVIVWFFAAVASFWFAHFSDKNAFENAAQLGDMFGVVNALFSGLAFALLINSNRVQQEEMRLTKEELLGQKIALEAQVKNMATQGFERNFFELLQVHKQNLNDIGFRESHGGSAISQMLDHIFNFEGFLNLYSDSEDREVTTLRMIERYKAGYSDFEQYIGHYFRNLYLLIRYVDEQDGIDSYFYVRIVRAQLSKSEINLIFYNCLLEDNDKMKVYVEKYSLLKHLNVGGIRRFDLMEGYYSSQAYGII